MLENFRANVLKPYDFEKEGGEENLTFPTLLLWVIHVQLM